MEISPVGSNARPAPVVAQESLSAEQTSERRQLIAASKVINENRLVGPGNELVFAVDPATKKLVMKVLDAKTSDVLMQIPTETVLRLAADLVAQQRSGHL